MSDLIRREDAIDAIYEHEFSNWCDKDEVSTILYDLPSADKPQGDEFENFDRESLLFLIDVQKERIGELLADRPQEWIPCSERLPKKEEATYLICTETGHMCSCRWTNNMYGLRSNEWSKWGWHIMDKPQYAKVVAWMPLKPWKGADDE